MHRITGLYSQVNSIYGQECEDVTLKALNHISLGKCTQMVITGVIMAHHYFIVNVLCIYFQVAFCCLQWSIFFLQSNSAVLELFPPVIWKPLPWISTIEVQD